jgi:hypothetical protein
MSKYNIDEMVYSAYFDYKHVKSELSTPNCVRVIFNKLSSVNKKVEEVNAKCKIEFLGDKIAFTPHYRRKIIRDNSHAKIVYVRDCIRKILLDLGFDTYVYRDRMYCGTIYVSLHEPKNKQRLQQLGNVFKFDCKTPVLTQTILDSIKQNKR